MTERNLPCGDTMKPGDVARLLAQFRLPSVDMSATLKSRRMDIKALVSANRLAVESIQGAASRQSDMSAQAMQSLRDHVTSALCNLNDPDRQSAVVKRAFEKTLADMQELAETARLARTDATVPVAHRVTQSPQRSKGPGLPG